VTPPIGAVLFCTAAHEKSGRLQQYVGTPRLVPHRKDVLSGPDAQPAGHPPNAARPFSVVA
jgi:hypothetical protein